MKLFRAELKDPRSVGPYLAFMIAAECEQDARDLVFVEIAECGGWQSPEEFAFEEVEPTRPEILLVVHHD